MKINSVQAKCKYCNQNLRKGTIIEWHPTCKSEIDKFQKIFKEMYGVTNPWILVWVNLLGTKLNIPSDAFKFKYIFSHQDLFVEIKEFTSYQIGTCLVFENLCFVRFYDPTWICLKEDTAIDANDYQIWQELDFLRMVRNYVYNSPSIIRQYTSNTLLQLYFSEPVRI